MVLCADDTLYTGVSNHVQRRLIEHNGSRTGARYTRSRRPVRLIHVEAVTDRAAAGRREHAIKLLSRSAKLALLNQHQGVDPAPDG